MTATDVLRRLLDEQGLEWREHEAPATDCIAFFDGNGWHDCWESVDGEVNVTFSMTPAQAIAATLGSCSCSDNCTNRERTETCKLTMDGTDGCFGCSECLENIPPLANYCPNCGRRIVDEKEDA